VRRQIERFIEKSLGPVTENKKAFWLNVGLRGMDSALLKLGSTPRGGRRGEESLGEDRNAGRKGDEKGNSITGKTSVDFGEGARAVKDRSKRTNEGHNRRRRQSKGGAE